MFYMYFEFQIMCSNSHNLFLKFSLKIYRTLSNQVSRFLGLLAHSSFIASSCTTSSWKSTDKFLLIITFFLFVCAFIARTLPFLSCTLVHKRWEMCAKHTNHLKANQHSLIINSPERMFMRGNVLTRSLSFSATLIAHVIRCTVCHPFVLLAWNDSYVLDTSVMYIDDSGRALYYIF